MEGITLSRFDYNEWKRYPLYHHAFKIGESRYYHVFILGKDRFTVETEGTQEQAAREAYNKCLVWLDRVIDTNGTFVIHSNAVDIATYGNDSGTIEFIGETMAQEIMEIEKREYELVKNELERTRVNARKKWLEEELSKYS